MASKTSVSLPFRYPSQNQMKFLSCPGVSVFVVSFFIHRSQHHNAAEKAMERDGSNSINNLHLSRQSKQDLMSIIGKRDTSVTLS